MGAHLTIQTSRLGDRNVGKVVGNQTLGNDETIQEAIDGGYVVGKVDLIGQSVKGVFKSMVNGIQKDGNGRKINEMVSIQPYATGRLDDVTDDIDREKIGAILRARLLKELKIDTSDWTFSVIGSNTNDIAVYSITTGEKLGVIKVGENIDINGFGLTLGTEGTVKWSVPSKGKSGTVAAAKLTGNDTRITIAGDALAELAAAEYNGEVIVFTIKAGTKTAVMSATLQVGE